jgi:hypothetical protein
MSNQIERRDFLKLAGLGGAVLASSLGPWGRALAAAGQDFSFVQMTDTHWGFEGPPNPEAKTRCARPSRRSTASSTSPTSSCSPAT